MEKIPTTQWTDENIVELIAKVRNDLLKDFLDERFLKDYIAAQFAVRELSNVRLEFIKKELKELFNAPVDTVHYQPVISSIRETDAASLSEGNEQLFYAEVERILKRYIYG